MEQRHAIPAKPCPNSPSIELWGNKWWLYKAIKFWSGLLKKRIYWKDMRLFVRLKGKLKNRKPCTRNYWTVSSWAPLLERVNSTCFFCSCVVLLKIQSPGGESLMDYVSILWMYWFMREESDRKNFQLSFKLLNFCSWGGKHLELFPPKLYIDLPLKEIRVLPRKENGWWTSSTWQLPLQSPLFLIWI